MGVVFDIPWIIVDVVDQDGLARTGDFGNNAGFVVVQQMLHERRCIDICRRCTILQDTLFVHRDAVDRVVSQMLTDEAHDLWQELVWLEHDR